MKKLIALFKTPADVDAFLLHYHDIHLPLVAKLPGLAKMEVTRIERTLAGEAGNFLLPEMHAERRLLRPETLRHCDDPHIPNRVGSARNTLPKSPEY